jgi:large-conductance mechanosensitive channel
MEFIKAQQQDFMKFTAYNNMLIIGAAGICIGLATKEAISEFLNDIILPFIVFLSQHSMFHQFIRSSVDKTSSMPYLFEFLKAILKTSWIFTVWLLILYITYIIFQKIIKIDLITPRVDLVESATKYVTSYNNNETNSKS